MAVKLGVLITRIRGWRWDAFGRALRAAIAAAIFLAAVPGMRPDPQDNAFQALGVARNHLFDFVQWEAAALADKAAVAVLGPQRYMDEAARTQFVRDYIALVDDIHALESRVQDIYAEPGITDPEAASAALRAERDALRAQQESQQALAESIVQAQVAQMLAEYGFGLGGEILPPVALRFTQLPTLLVTSPRDRIERTGSYPLEHGLTVDQMDDLEAQVEGELGVSALIVPLGGLAVWPAMQIETGYLPHVFEITAHEWTHHYLTFFPLGMNYGTTPEMFTINETVASLIGNEIGWAVLDRYYPDLAPAPPDYTPQPAEPAPAPDTAEPPAFDFRAEMRETRIRVDDLLAAGEVEEAERYMEERRALFVENGYRIRRLNQAYFAFYGSYADQPGATGADPIGPALRELRYYSPSLYDFAAVVRSVTSFAELQQVLDQTRAAHEAGG
jgi:hypothetical protein